ANLLLPGSASVPPAHFYHSTQVRSPAPHERPLRACAFWVRRSTRPDTLARHKFYGARPVEGTTIMVSNESSVTRNEQTQVAEEDAKALLQKYDRESNIRERIGVWAWVVTFLGVALTVFHLYTGYFGTFP